MPTYKYKALHGDKTSYEGTCDAKDRFEVYGIVRKDGGTIVSVEEVTRTKTLFTADIIGALRRVNDTDKILLTRNLGAMLQAGLSLSRALAVVKRQSRKPRLVSVVDKLTNEIERGGSLSSGMLQQPKIFPNLVTSMVAAGEEAGTLAETLVTISEQLERAYELKKKIKGAMIYPSIVIIVLLLIGSLMLIYTVPTLTATFRDMDAELPATTQVVMVVSDFLVAHTLMALMLVIALVLTVIATMRTARGRRVFEFVFLHTPIIGKLVRDTNSARTGRTLASLLASGVNVLTAINITKDVLQNSYYKEVLVRAGATVQKGQPLAQVFVDAEQLYPPLVGELIAVGEETGALPDMLKEVAHYYEREVSQKTKNMSTIIEPFLMLFVGGAVGFFAVAMISPIYSITSSIH